MMMNFCGIIKMEAIQTKREMSEEDIKRKHITEPGASGTIK